MPRYNVENPKTKKWRCYSSVTNEWLTDWMDKKSYQLWRNKEYGRGCGPLNESNLMSLQEAESRMKAE